MIDYGISITQEEAVKVLEYFDKDGNGTVDFDEFLTALKVMLCSNFAGRLE